MNQRNDTPGGEQERGRDTNGGREYSGSQGFDDARASGYGDRESSGRERGTSQPLQGQYERDSHMQQQPESRERWHGGFERSPSYRSREGESRYGHDPRRDWRGGSYGGHSESDRYRPVTEEWEAARGYGDMGREEPRYGGGDWRGQHERSGQEQQYGREERWNRGNEGRYGGGRYGSEGRGGWSEGRYEGEGRYGGGQSGWGSSRHGGESRYGQGGWRGASQPNYGGRNYWTDRPSWRDQYGFGRRYREQSGEQLFDREPFGHREDPHYYGTGAAGWGGPGFTGGAFGFGDSTRFQQRPIESEYSDESSVGYEGSYGRGYGQGGGIRRQYARGPKGYQRSDERLKEDISERLMEAYHIDSSEVTVEVQGAKVILEGTVPSRHMKHAIEDLVDACPGVQDIENKVRVAGPNYQGAATGSTAGSGTTGAMTGTGSTARTGTSTQSQSGIGSQTNNTRTKQ